MNAQHTPGPWRYEYDDNGFFEITSEVIARRVAFTQRQGDTDEANARLIAAAPELLDVMHWWLQQMADDACDDMGKLLDDMSKKARAAIAKATGEQS